MTFFIKSGNTFTVHAADAIDLKNKLPAGIYTLDFSMKLGLFLTTTPDFQVPTKVYGNTTRNSERIWKTFQARGKSTGVLLSGEKGSGKTLLAKDVAN